MLLSFVLAAATALPPVSRDTSTYLSTPTVSRAPIVGIRGIVVADSIVVEKEKRTLTLYREGMTVRTYQVALGKQPAGDKIRRGDGRTPEGVFHIDFRNSQSKYHMSLHISYPDAVHVQRASALHASAGGDIMIHGLPPAYADLGAAHREIDWTEGCIAVTDAEIEEIWRAVPNGAPIQIKP